jgi:5-dehydro-4-deoxyglucarate dehydratase
MPEINRVHGSFMSASPLTTALRSGLLFFPLSDFDAEGRVDLESFRRRVDRLSRFDVKALFVTSGAGEFFSLSPAECAVLCQAAVEARPAAMPVIAASGYGTNAAVDYARLAEQCGADGILLLPPYLTETSQEGLRAHVTAVCRATGLGVIIYNRANCRLNAETLARLAEDCPNLVALKDGIGDVEELLRMQSSLGDRLVFINGMPTAEIYALSYKGMGVDTYSSAIFNFVPRTAVEFFNAVSAGDTPTVGRIMREFLLPYMRIRSRQPGYAVSIIKAGVDIVGFGGGKVRPPLSDLTAGEFRELAELIERLGPQDAST